MTLPKSKPGINSRLFWIYLIGSGIGGWVVLTLSSIWLEFVLYIVHDEIKSLLSWTFMPFDFPTPPTLAPYLWPSKYLWERAIHGFLLGAMTATVVWHWRERNREFAARFALKSGVLLSTYLFWVNFSPFSTYLRVVPESVRLHQTIGVIMYVFLYHSEFQWALGLFLSGLFLCLKIRRKKIKH